MGAQQCLPLSPLLHCNRSILHLLSWGPAHRGEEDVRLEGGRTPLGIPRGTEQSPATWPPGPSAWHPTTLASGSGASPAPHSLAREASKHGAEDDLQRGQSTGGMPFQQQPGQSWDVKPEGLMEVECLSLFPGSQEGKRPLCVRVS